ncbi:hypothetical protein BH10PSE11_BH10PSE11_15290 [soil metagenome]
MDDAEVDEADATWAMRRDFRLGGPAIDDAPIVEHHVVDAVGHDRPAISDDIDVRTIDGKDATSDLVSGAGRNSAVAVNRIGLQTAHVQPAGLVAAAAHKNPAAAHRRAIATGRETDEIRTDNHAGVLLHVPQRERAVDDVDAVSMGPFFHATGVGRDDVEAIHIDMTCAHVVTRQNLDAAGRCHAAQFNSSETFDRSIVEDRALVCRRVETKIVNPVVRRQLKAVASRGESDLRSVAVSAQHLSRRKADGRRIGQAAVNDDLTGADILGGSDQLLDCGGGLDGGCRFRGVHATDLPVLVS